MPITKADQSVIETNICTTDTTQTITGAKNFSNLSGNISGVFSGNASSATALATGSNTSRAFQNRFNDIVNVKDFGAIGNNIADDTAAIQAAIDYATSIGSGVYFPNGSFKTNSGIILKCGCLCTPGAQIIAGSQSITTVKIPIGNYNGTFFFLPQIVGGENGLMLMGANLCTIYLTNIALANNGLVLRISETEGKSCADNNIFFNVINACSKAGIKFDHSVTNKNGSLFQGNIIKGNFIVAVKYGIHFYDANNGSLGFELYWDDTIIEVGAIDPTLTFSPSIGVYGEPFLPPRAFTLRSEAFFQGFDIGIKGTGNGNLYRIANHLTYDQNQLEGIGNQIINTSYAMQAYPDAPFVLTPTPNTRLTWMGGNNQVQFNRFGAVINLTSGLAAGTAQTFYFYHPLMTRGFPKVTVEPCWNVPMQILFAVENGTTGQNAPDGTPPSDFQGAIRFYAHANIPVGTYYMIITVHNTP